jgi:RimJ/RimL family protein N-acetyltransferase
MPISTQLYKGKLVHFTAIDPENDPAIESTWTKNSGYMRMLSTNPMRPQSPIEIKKKLEAIEKECEDENELYHFQVHRTSDDLLIGFGQILYISWPNRNAVIQLGIGDSANNQQGYGSEILSMILEIAFSELNLERMTAFIPEYNLAAKALFEKFGFTLEGRRRQAVYRDLRRWDILIYGLAKVFQ